MILFIDLPKDLLLYIGGFLDYNAICSLASITRSAHVVFDSNQLWRQMYYNHFAIPRIGPKSVHRGRITRELCGDDVVCNKKHHYNNLEHGEAIKRKYNNYKKSFARRLETKEALELKTRYKELSPRTDYFRLSSALTETIKNAYRIQRQMYHAKRMAFVYSHGVKELYAWAHVLEPRRRKPKPKKPRVEEKKSDTDYFTPERNGQTTYQGFVNPECDFD